MAKTSQVVRNNERSRKAKLHFEKRAALKKVIADPNVSPEEKFEAMRKLDEMPRNGSKVRIHNRCSVSGRSRAFIRDFGLSRIKFREMAQQGYLPGVRMASW